MRPHRRPAIASGDRAARGPRRPRRPGRRGPDRRSRRVRRVKGRSWAARARHAAAGTRKLERTRTVGLPDGLFSDDAEKLLASWKTRASSEYPAWMRARSPAIRVSLCWSAPRRSPTPSSELLIALVHEVTRAYCTHVDGHQRSSGTPEVCVMTVRWRREERLMRKLVGTGSKSGAVPLGRVGDVCSQPQVWVAFAAALTLSGPRGRRAALRGVTCSACASLLHLPIKRALGRPRPRGARVIGGIGPLTSSFPLGHTAATCRSCSAHLRNFRCCWLRCRSRR